MLARALALISIFVLLALPGLHAHDTFGPDCIACLHTSLAGVPIDTPVAALPGPALLPETPPLLVPAPLPKLVLFRPLTLSPPHCAA